MIKFKSKETEKYLKNWLNGHPESWHSMDYEKFYNFITSLFKEDDFITESELRSLIIENKEWKDEKFITRFIDDVLTKINELRNYFDYMQKRI